jgi:hypothetical protein
MKLLGKYVRGQKRCEISSAGFGDRAKAKSILMAALGATLLAATQSMAGWTAYNDCSWKSGQLNADITTYGQGESGTMVDHTTGNPVAAVLEIVDGGATENGGGGPMPDSGTEAFSNFNGIVSFDNVLYYGAEGWYVDAVFTGLDPDKEYEFVTSCNRGSSDYTTRWSKFTISGIDSATQSSTPGVQVNSDTSVSFCSGDNSANGYVACWAAIKCGEDGSFTVRAEADGQNGNDVRKGYAFDGLLLREVDSEEPAFAISNPYDEVDWNTATSRKANFHTHTTQSDGNMSPDAVIDTYASYGYAALALTDHNLVTYPWSDYSRDPATVGMVDVEGNELSYGHHIVSLFCGYASTSSDETALLTGVGEAGGLAFIAHPGRYSYDAQWYADHYLAHSHCVGQEIYNQGDRYPDDRKLWDEVLTILMPDRPVWGFSNDDAHQLAHMGRNRTYFPFTGDLTQNAVSNALIQGSFYATYSTSSTYEPPLVTGIEIDEVNGVITLTASNYTSVSWISGGTEVATGESIDLSATPGVVDYVRAELVGPEGSTYLNPFGISGSGGNELPVASAGSDQIVTDSDSSGAEEVVLDGSGSSDSDGSIVSYVWSEDGTQVATGETATVSLDVGEHALTLTVTDDAGATAADTTTITVVPYGQQLTVSVRIASSSDDIEQGEDGSMYLDSSDLELAYDSWNSQNYQLVGMRFLDINIPQGATIVDASIQFACDETSSGSVSLTIQGQAADDAVGFSTTDNDAGNRTKTTAQVSWSPAAWDTVGEAGDDQLTPNLAAVIQEITDRSGWATGNAMALFVSGSTAEKRVAESYDGTSSSAPQLTITYTMGEAENQAPTADAGSDQSVSDTDSSGAESVTLDGSGSSDSDGTIASYVWSEDDTQIATGETPTVSLAVGVYTLTLTVTDDEGATSTDTVNVSVTGNLADGWTAFNDCVYQGSGYKATNATIYGIGKNATCPASGMLRDIDSGSELPVTVTFTATGDVTWQPSTSYGGSDCAAGTDAFETFGNVVDMGGVIYYGSAGWTVQVQFDGLDTDGVYEFATSANRDGSSYTDRTTIYSIQGADEFHAAGTEGVVTDGTNQTFCTGYNTAAGNVARWVGIRPGSDGSFTVSATHTADSSDGRKAYAFDVFRLHRSSGFEAWAQEQGLRGTDGDFALVGSNGVPYAMKYAFGENLVLDEPVIDIFMQNGQPVVDIPAQDASTESYVRIELKGSTNLTSSSEWTLETHPADDTTEKPANRQWLETDTMPDSGFFRLEVERVD